jgi:hypothetical protein
MKSGIIIAYGDIVTKIRDLDEQISYKYRKLQEEEQEKAEEHLEKLDFEQCKKWLGKG